MEGSAGFLSRPEHGAALAAMATLLANAGTKYQLYAAGPTPPDQDSLHAAFTLSVFTGYADVLGTGVTVTQGRDDQDDDILTVQGLQFKGGNPLTVGETVVGLIIYDSIGSKMVAVIPFDSPEPVVRPDQLLTMTLQFNDRTQTFMLDGQ